MIVFTHGELIPEKDVAKIKANIEDLCNGIEPVMMDLSDREQPRPKTQAIKKELFPFLMSVTSPTTKVPVRAFTVGYPNVGKSTFLYVVTKDTTQEIKKKGLFHRPKIANTPGYTTTLKPHWLSWKPPVRLIDSPVSAPEFCSTCWSTDLTTVFRVWFHRRANSRSFLICSTRWL